MVWVVSKALDETCPSFLSLGLAIINCLKDLDGQLAISCLIAFVEMSHKVIF